MAFYSLLLLVAFFAMAGALVAPKIFEDELIRPRSLKGTCDLKLCLRKSPILKDPISGLNLKALNSTQAVEMSCQTLVEMQSCISDSLGPCSEQYGGVSEIAPLVNAVEGVHSYLCLEGGKEVAKMELPCWKNMELNTEIQRCLQSVVAAHESLGSGDMCTSIHGIRDCFVGATYWMCSERAVEFVDNMIYRVLQPFAIYRYGCDINPPMTQE